MSNVEFAAAFLCFSVISNENNCQLQLQCKLKAFACQENTLYLMQAPTKSLTSEQVTVSKVEKIQHSF